jgi:hypothetical protein
MTLKPSCLPAPPLLGSPCQCDGAGKRLQACAAVEPGRHDKIRLALFDGIWGLAREDRRQALRSHAGSMQDPRRLYEAWRTHDDHGVASPLAAGFEQQRDVQRDQRAPLARAATQKPGRHPLDVRVNDGFEPA